MVGASGCGLVVPPDDVASIKNAILTLYRQWKEGRLSVLVNRSFVERYTWKALTRRFVDTLEDAMATASPAKP